MEELDELIQRLKSDVQAAIDEADQGLCEPLDIEAIKAELNAEFDAKGPPYPCGSAATGSGWVS